MKNCTDFAPLLSAFFDGELTEAQCAEVRAHLAECEACRARLAEYAAMQTELLAAFEEEETPAGFTENVMAAVRAEKSAMPKKAKRRAWRQLMPVAACAALVLFAVSLFPGTSKMSESLSADSAAPMRVEDMAENSSAPADAYADQEAANDTELADGYYSLSHDSAYREERFATGGDMSTGTQLDPQSAKSAVNGGYYLYNDNDADGYFCELREIDGEEGLLWVEEHGAVLLTLYGAGATEYVAENGGVKDGDAGYWYLPVSALFALPDELYLSTAQAQALEDIPEDAEWAIVDPYDEEEVPHA